MSSPPLRAQVLIAAATVLLIYGLVEVLHPLTGVDAALVSTFGLVPAYFGVVYYHAGFDYPAFSQNEGLIGVAVALALATVAVLPLTVLLGFLADRFVPWPGAVVRLAGLVFVTGVSAGKLAPRLVFRLNPEYRVEDDVA